ncbi:hypothetical protein KY332_02845 [Candidatus Woesearchaeota archaeon]|nr:hypothetical protein [Candidatus Woesearchaeota archaeon]
MVNKVFLGILVMLLLVSPVLAVDLSNFPGVFLDEVRVVVGRSAKAEDVLGAIDIVAALQQRVGTCKRVGGAVLDTEVESLESMNTIVVGGPCINSAAARLLGYPENCLEGFEMGKGIIRIYEFDTGKYGLLAAGTTALDTRRVTSVLANYNDYALSGAEMMVTGLSISDIEIDSK